MKSGPSRGNSAVLDKRRAGILLHPTSLPGMGRYGVLGEQAYRFVDFLAACRMSVWQVLPLGPTHADGSPYSSLSVHAGNPELISLQWLVDKASLDSQALEDHSHMECLLRAFQQFQSGNSLIAQADYARFCDSHAYWLDDFAIYSVLRNLHGDIAWTEWPDSVRLRQTDAIRSIEQQHATQIARVKFEQYLFFSQWRELRQYANLRGIQLFGDMPIFVAHDSADVWANRRFFSIDENGNALKVAGVPPDYFSETGQLWGNPLYDWNALRAEDFSWWVDRMRTQLEMYDLVRIDHFRGLQACWEIPASAETAMEGEWVESPGNELLDTLRNSLGSLPLVAEDLGVITPEVTELRERHNLPGMKILQFAFDGSSDNPYLPENHSKNFVVYSGTHDNDTILGWFQSLPRDRQEYVLDYLGNPSEAMPWPIIRATLASPALLAIIPMQDILGLGTEHRMNTPGTIAGNWSWRMEADTLEAVSPGALSRMVEECDRV